MKKKWLKAVAFLGIFLVLFSLETVLLMNKTTNVHQGFYRQKKNSIDVVYVGSSHAFCSFSIYDMFREYGFTGYIRATSCQRSWESYALLAETFRYQKPKVVVYEVMAAYQNDPQYEAFGREVYDTMRPSKEKVGGILEELSDSGKDVSYLIPMFRYHERWKELAKEDFTYFTERELVPNKGFEVALESKPAVEYDEGYYDRQMDAVDCGERSRQCILDMKQLCDENGAKLVLVKAPTIYESYWNVGMSQGMQAFADEISVPFIDYNTNGEIAIDWQSETCDEGNHLNYEGAKRLSSLFGAYIRDTYELPDHRNDLDYNNWEKDAYAFEKQIAKKTIVGLDMFDAYIDILQQYFVSDSDYVVLMTGKTDLLNGISVEQKQKLLAMGNNLNYEGVDSIDPNIFVIRGGEILNQKQTPESIEELFYIDEHKIMLSLLSKEDGNCCDVLIDGEAVSLDAMGLNIMIYDMKQGSVLDSVYAKFDKKGILRIYRE